MSNSPVKCLVFDIGNVLWDTYLLNTLCLRRWALLLNLSYDEFYQGYLSIYREIEVGRKSILDLATLFQADPNDLKSVLHECLGDDLKFFQYLNHDLIRLLPYFQRHYQLGCLSNTESFMDPYLRRHISPKFDFSIFSYEVGFRKPESQIYLQIFKHVQCLPSEVVFIDDKPENINGAHSVGLKALQYENFSKLVSDLAFLGVNVPTPEAYTT